MVANTDDSGAGSLRQATLDANADAATGTASIPETINFAIPGTGTHTIAPATPLPTIGQPTIVDATIQPGLAGSPLVALDGIDAASADGTPVVGLIFQSAKLAAGPIGGGASGLEIIRFSGTAIVANTQPRGRPAATTPSRPTRPASSTLATAATGST